MRGNLSAPAKPNAGFVLKCGLNGNFKPSGVHLGDFSGMATLFETTTRAVPIAVLSTALLNDPPVMLV